ncbi:MAG: hypothetical protein ABIM88_06175 [candidate division WOR-3 bacterium]
MQEEYIKQLEETLKKFLSPVRDIPFTVVIKVLSGHRILPIYESMDWAEDFISNLERAIQIAGAKAKEEGIKTKRPNEAGNKIEDFVLEGLRSVEIPAQRPIARSGRKKPAGYPDFELEWKGIPVYLECKTFNSEEERGGGLRVFYLSPSEDFKITKDAPHILVAFGMKKEGENLFVPVSYEIYTLENLKVNLKHEFNASAQELYLPESLLAHGEIGN